MDRDDVVDVETTQCSSQKEVDDLIVALRKAAEIVWPREPADENSGS